MSTPPNIITPQRDNNYITHQILLKQLEDSETQRKQIINDFDKVKVRLGEITQVTRELREVQQQKEILEYELSQYILVCQEEREKVCRLMSQNTVLSSQIEDDRIKISNLLGISRGISGDGFQLGCNNNNINNNNNNNTHKSNIIHKQTDVYNNNNNNNNKSYHLSSRTPKAISTNTISLRSIVTDFANPLNNNNNNNNNNNIMSGAGSTVVHGVEPFTAVGVSSITMEAIQVPPGSTLVSSLSKEVYTLTQLLDDQRNTYEYNRSRRREEERRRNEELEEINNKQLGKIARLEEELHVAVKELCLYRHNQHILERSLRAEIKQLQEDCIATTKHYTSMNSKETQDLHLALELAVNKSNNIASDFRNDIILKGQEHQKEREYLEGIINNLRERNNNIQNELKKERAARKRAEERYKLEKAGTNSEILILKQQLRNMEKKTYFSHIKGEQEVTAAAKLISSLVSEQIKQQMQVDGGDGARDRVITE